MRMSVSKLQDYYKKQEKTNSRLLSAEVDEMVNKLLTPRNNFEV